MLEVDVQAGQNLMLLLPKHWMHQVVSFGEALGGVEEGGEEKEGKEGEAGHGGIQLHSAVNMWFE